jgi:hypothetical protein
VYDLSIIGIFKSTSHYGRIISSGVSKHPKAKRDSVRKAINSILARVLIFIISIRFTHLISLLFQ